MLKDKLSNNMKLKFFIKNIQRKFFIKKMKSKSIKQLMKYNADLFEIRQGYELDWSNLSSYSEKMQWDKIFNNDPRKVICADKYSVRKWVSDRIGEDYLIPLIGVWDSVDQINFSELPNQFVLKTNCSSGDVIIVKDKSMLSKSDIDGIKSKLNYYLNMKFGYNTCELHYNKIQPKIIAESFIDNGLKDLQDYKFLCFDGKAYFCWVDIGRYHNHKRNIYDMDWTLQDWNQYSYGNSDKNVPKPYKFKEMVDIAEKLSKGFSHVRVDLYEHNKKIYFGEMTFTNSSGFERIEPKEADFMLGGLWNINCLVPEEYLE